MRDRGESRLAIEAMARAGGASVGEFTGRRAAGMPPYPKRETSCRCTTEDATDCDGGGVAQHADGACGCPCHGGAEATNAVTAHEPECTGETARAAVDTMDAATEAFDAIAKLCGCPMWDYPGQVVRDVQTVVAERDALREFLAVYDAAVEFVAAERELTKVHPALRTRSEDGIAAVDRVLKARRALKALVPLGPDTVPTTQKDNDQ